MPILIINNQIFQNMKEMDEQRQINLKELSIKWRNKKEKYDLLAADGDVYMPPFSLLTYIISEE